MPPTSRLGRALAVALPCFLAFALYLPSAANPLVWDDELHVPAAVSGDPERTAAARAGEYRRPVVMASYRLQAAAGAASPAALHVGNALLHAVATGLLVGLLLRMALPAATAAAAGVIFAAHPVSSAAVAYVSGRTDLLAAIFTLAALHAAAAAGRLGTAAAAILAGSMCVLAGLSKESGVMAGPLVVALWWHGAAGRRGGDGSRSRAVAVAGLAASAVTFLFVAPPAALDAAVPLPLRVRGAGTTLLTLAGLLVWPHDLHLDRLTPVGGALAAAAGVAFAAAAVASAFAFYRRPTLPRLAALAAVLLYLPVSNLVPIYPRIAEHLVFTGEQFAYLPLAPLSALVASGIAAAAAARGTAATLAGAALLAAAWTPAVLARQHQLGDAERVYTATLAHSPSPRACFNLGNLQLSQRRFEEAARTYERCVALSPHDAETHGQLAIAYQNLRRAEQARRAYERAVELDAASALLWSNFATLDANERRFEDARRKWQRALELDPAFMPARDALARLPK